MCSYLYHIYIFFLYIFLHNNDHILIWLVMIMIIVFCVLGWSNLHFQQSNSRVLVSFHNRAIINVAFMSIFSPVWASLLLRCVILWMWMLSFCTIIYVLFNWLAKLGNYWSGWKICLWMLINLIFITIVVFPIGPAWHYFPFSNLWASGVYVIQSPCQWKRPDG